MFRVLLSSFQAPGIVQQLTIENLLKAVAISSEEVDSWRYLDFAYFGMDGTNPELRNPMPPPDDDYLEIFIWLKNPAETVPEADTPRNEVPLEVVAGTGPRPMSFGSTPAMPQPTIRPHGFNPRFSAFSSDMTTTAAPPSTMPLAFPAVTVPFLPKAGFNFARPSIAVCGRR